MIEEDHPVSALAHILQLTGVLLLLAITAMCAGAPAMLGCWLLHHSAADGC
jgi:hypothetical protein